MDKAIYELSDYLRTKFSVPVNKIAIDAGFHVQTEMALKEEAVAPIVTTNPFHLFM